MMINDYTQDFGAGYNSAISDMEQKAKKFLEDNFKIYEKSTNKIGNNPIF